MTGTGRRSFRRRLTILLVLALIPVVVLSVMKARDVRTLRVEQQLTRNLTLARAVAYSVDEYIVSTGGFLQALAQSDMARDGDFDALSTWFRAMLPNYPYYFNILFVDVDGVARATSRPSDSGEPCVLSDTAVLARLSSVPDLVLTDPNDMVQKGYGWLLKEASRKHTPEVFAYVMKKKSVMPRTSLRYAIELMPKELRSEAMKKP